MDDLLTPDWDLPFRLVGDDFPQVEQGSDRSIYNNVVTILRYNPEDRDSIPEFGVRDQTFREGGADLNIILNAVLRWEPDATIQVLREAMTAEGIDYIEVDVNEGASNG